MPQHKIQNREIRFEVTNKCNAKCIMCPREKMEREQGIMDMELYTRLLDESYSYGARVVSLENYGEPFLDPFFFERAAYAKNKGMEIYTISNGSLFSRKLANQSLDYLDKIRFSVYGTTKEVYEEIHVNLNFETVISNIEYLINEKRRKSRKNPHIGVYFLLMKENRHQVEDFKEKWVGNVDEVAIWKPHNWSDGRNYRIMQTGEKITCGRPENGPIQAQWDGLVVPCCFDYDSSIVIGDLKKQTLHEVLTGEPYNDLRTAHKRGDFSAFPFCDSCDQLQKRNDVLVFSTLEDSKVGAVNTTFDGLA